MTYFLSHMWVRYNDIMLQYYYILFDHILIYAGRIYSDFYLIYTYIQIYYNIKYNCIRPTIRIFSNNYIARKRITHGVYKWRFTIYESADSDSTG